MAELRVFIEKIAKRQLGVYSELFLQIGRRRILLGYFTPYPYGGAAYSGILIFVVFADTLEFSIYGNIRV